MKFHAYQTEGYYDEMFAADGVPRPGASFLVQRINALPGGELHHRQRAAEQALLHLGITFNVYGDELGQNASSPLILFRALSRRRIGSTLSAD